VALPANVKAIAPNLTVARIVALIHARVQVVSVALTVNAMGIVPNLPAAQVVALVRVVSKNYNT